MTKKPERGQGSRQNGSELDRLIERARAARHTALALQDDSRLLRLSIRHPAREARPRRRGADPGDDCRCVVALAASAGGLLPLWQTLADLPADFPAAVIVLLHRAPASRLPEFLDDRIPLPVSEAVHGEVLRPGRVFVAPTGVHMAVEASGRVALRDGLKVNFTRPSADVLFRSLAESFGPRAIAVVFSGHGTDGSAGTRAIRRTGGVVLSQHEQSAEHAEMPMFAIDLGKVDLVLRTEQIATAVRLLAAGS